MNFWSRWVIVWENNEKDFALTPISWESPWRAALLIGLELLHWQWKGHFLNWGAEMGSVEWWGNNLKATINIKNTDILLHRVSQSLRWLIFWARSISAVGLPVHDSMFSTLDHHLPLPSMMVKTVGYCFSDPWVIRWPLVEKTVLT